MYGNKPWVWKTCPSWSLDLHHGKAVLFKVDLLKRSLDYD
jgi:hypothetical protein